MTAGDDPSGSDDGTGVSVLAALVIGSLEAAAAFGLSVPELRARAGLGERELADPDGRVPRDGYTRLLQAIDAAAGAEQFGFWLGETVSVRSLGVAGFAMQHAADVRSAFRCLERFRSWLGERASSSIEEQADRVVFRQRQPPELARLGSLGVAAPVGALTLLRELSSWRAGAQLALEVSFQHAPPPDLDRYRTVFACPVSFGAAETRLEIVRAVFDVPVRRADPSLFAYLERHQAALLSRQLDRGSSSQLRAALLPLLPEGEPEPSSLARRLGLSERTLQRRLHAEGTSFAALLDELRLDLARRYLGDAQLALYEIAYLLGYSEGSAFQHEFRRWTGQSPREHRRTARVPS